MQRFHVPQFIEVEDKIFGPLTLKQFIYVLGGSAISFIIWIALPRLIAIIFIVPVAALSLGLAFYKVNGLPLLQVIANMFQYYFRGRLYLWRQERVRKEAKKEFALGQENTDVFVLPRTKKGKLNDLAWSLDVHENITARERAAEKTAKEREMGIGLKK